MVEAAEPAVSAIRLRERAGGYDPEMSVVYFKSDDDGDGTYDGQIGHAYLHPDDGSTGDEGRDLGFIKLARAAKIAEEHDAELDVDGPTREEWARGPRRSLADRLLGR